MEKLGFRDNQRWWRALSDSLMVRNRLEQLYKDHESESYLGTASSRFASTITENDEQNRRYQAKGV